MYIYIYIIIYLKLNLYSLMFFFRQIAQTYFQICLYIQTENDIASHDTKHTQHTKLHFATKKQLLQRIDIHSNQRFSLICMARL